MWALVGEMELVAGREFAGRHTWNRPVTRTFKKTSHAKSAVGRRALAVRFRPVDRLQIDSIKRLPTGGLLFSREEHV